MIEIKAKFESRDENDNFTESYWETILFDADILTQEMCEDFYHHDICLVSMRDTEATLIDIEWVE